jgi:hypothetical protein
MTSSIPDSFGASPASVQWKVVRGDTARLRIEFLNNDEVTMYDTSTWTFTSTAYDPKADQRYTLATTPFNGYVDVVASPTITSSWGTGSNAISAELSFDLQVIIDEDTVWTPIIGTIVVLSDVTPVGGP